MSRGRWVAVAVVAALAIIIVAGTSIGLGAPRKKQAVMKGSMAVTKGGKMPMDPLQMMKARTTDAMRKAAAKRAAAKRAAGVSGALTGLSALFAGKANSQYGIAPAPLAFDPQGKPDYFGTVPNWANSPLPEVDASGNPVPGTGIRKFVDSLPGFGKDAANDLGNYIPVAVPDTTTYPGSDYYEIGLVEYTQKLHADLPPTKFRGYVQLNTTDPDVGKPSYLGPTIVARRDRPVRVKFTNLLPTGTDGDLFIPTDTTAMGAGMGPTGAPYKQNRATLHLHGGATPWISDGTPHQWTTPAGEDTEYPKGVSVYNVPDMPDPGPGSLTFFYTNQQSARLMFYHDHAYGLTRLNVYAGEAAGYVVTDPVEDELVNGNLSKPIGDRLIPAAVAPATVPTEQIPVIIQDKTFVPTDTQLLAQDPTWDRAKWGTEGSLWFPHVYMPNQNPYDDSGANAMGRWDYGPWFWPPQPAKHGVTAAGDPGTPNPSLVPEGFMDTPLVNGTPYPFKKVGRKAYRFRILNASNDRFWNLQLYYAKSNSIDSTDPVTGLPTMQTMSGEVSMTPAISHPEDPTWPATWPSDGRAGGVPDPYTAGPDFIQIGTEGGLLPAPVTLPMQPVNYVYNRRDIVVLNVSDKTLFLGPAERADVIVDFSQVPDGSKLILYNDSPAPVPAFDPRNDYYTGDPDQRDTGGAPPTFAGYGPNTRTIMQFQVEGATAAPAFDTTALAEALPLAYRASQDKPIIPEQAYGDPTNKYVRIQANTVTFTPEGTSTVVTMPLEPKAIQELFELEYGRMNATLGVERPFTTAFNQTTIPYGFIDPATENMKDVATPAAPVTLNDGTQIWKITHNGVDTHAIHFHLFNVQVVNRVGWDGAIRPPDANELGWKETVRMNPLEDIIVAMRPVAPDLPFKVGNSVRLLDPTMPEGTTLQFTGVDPNGNPITVRNLPTNFGWEYVWHCHLLGHEENDMMRPITMAVAPSDSTTLSATAQAPTPITAAVNLAWTNHWTSPAATSITVQRADDAAFTTSVRNFTTTPNAVTYTDTTTARNRTYFYRVRPENAKGFAAWSNRVSVATTATVAGIPGPPTLVSLTPANTTMVVRWTAPPGGGQTGYYVERASNVNGPFTRVGNVGAGATSFTATGLFRRTTYFFQVRSYNVNGISGPSNILNARTL